MFFLIFLDDVVYVDVYQDGFFFTYQGDNKKYLEIHFEGEFGGCTGLSAPACLKNKQIGGLWMRGRFPTLKNSD